MLNTQSAIRHDLARDCAISVNTARSWLSILEASFQILLLRPYHSNLTKRLYQTPKLYFLDTGLAAYLTEWTSPETLEAGAMSGAIFETFVVAEILKSWWHRAQFPSLYFYRDKEGREVDLLWQQDRNLYAVEIKKGSKVHSDWTRSFAALERFGTLRACAVVCLCPEPVAIDRRTKALCASEL